MSLLNPNRPPRNTAFRPGFTLWLAAAGLGLALSAPAENPPPQLQLRAAAQVGGTGVFIADVVEGDFSPLTNACLAAPPAPAQTLVLTRAQIAEAVAKNVPGLALTNWSGAHQVKVTRQVRRLEEGELKDLLTATLQRESVRERGQLELCLGRPWTAVNVPDEPLQIRLLELPLTGVSPNFILRFELRTERESVGIYQIPLQARVWREIWVARSAQPRGRLLPEADLGTERRDVLLVRDALVAVDPADATLELAQSLAAGAPLTQRAIRIRPVVQRGKLLDAVVMEGPLMITVKVEALEAGIPGQAIRVRNVRSKREFHAQVQNEQTVIVPL